MEKIEKTHKKRYTIVYTKNECIGAFACVAAEPDTWKQVEDRDKADLIGGILKMGDEEEVYVKEVDELNNNLEAAQSCPVNCIHIIDNQTGRKII
ncbi:ferredoxin [Candidatus Woesearchaeota archaeon CG10_big_fil_rev_8_21_14_0_10_32_9]|nr:MAG: ferredoxin [Candidatus Woesearchaeota archaeon CG10_big_fil_rev_8_21_14_0_10_32_9]